MFELRAPAQPTPLDPTCFSGREGLDSSSPDEPSDPRWPESPRDGRARPLVVLVEDEPSTQDIYRTILEFAGYDVVVVGDGVEAVTLIREALPDVVLMDINLPGQDGWEATKALKRDERTKSIPVVGVSASAGPAFTRRAERLGFQAYHAKPLPPSAVLAAVQRVFEADGD